MAAKNKALLEFEELVALELDNAHSQGTWDCATTYDKKMETNTKRKQKRAVKRIVDAAKKLVKV